MSAEKELTASWAAIAKGETLDQESPQVAAFRELVVKHRERVYRVARQMVGSHEDADDVVQEVFCRTFERLEQFRGDAALTTWLYRATVNAALNHLRARNRRLQFLRRWVHRANRPALPSPHSKVEWDEMREQVREAIEALSPRLRAVVVLADLEGLSAPEVARILQIPEGTVRSRLYAARRQLRERLEPLFASDREGEAR
ncbi:MAG: hypothetical protein KatS3mg115_0163 [Candidatus Poribacteria bacterium]|nr:MAG: hypothetical protein KatS3mg115_0163 [Candidatus Poribacteria bacterium]